MLTITDVRAVPGDAAFLLDDGETAVLYDTVIALPGHTRCSVGYYWKAEKLLLSCETLGVYFGQGTYLPSCLVGYQMTLDSIEKAKKLEIDQLLLPHYGLAQEPAEAYLQKAEAVCRETAERMRELSHQGKTREEIVDLFVAEYHRPHVAPVYPIDAFRLNTGIMAQLIAWEFRRGDV